MGLQRRQYVGAAAKINLAEMGKFGKDKTRLAPFSVFEAACITAGKGGTARRASTVLRDASH
jgi:hypothetical protein